MPNPMTGAGAGAVKMPAIAKRAPGHNPMNAIPVTLGNRKSISIMFNASNYHMSLPSLNPSLLTYCYYCIMT
jgi:hypothetical protein